MRTGQGLVILEVPVRRDQRLPDAIQVGTAVRQPGRAIRPWELRASRAALLTEQRGNTEGEKSAETGNAKEHHHAPKLHTGPPEVRAEVWYHARPLRSRESARARGRDARRTVARSFRRAARRSSVTAALDWPVLD